MVIKRGGQQQKQDSLRRGRRKTVLSSESVNLASVEAMNGVGREARDDDKQHGATKEQPWTMNGQTPGKTNPTVPKVIISNDFELSLTSKVEVDALTNFVGVALGETLGGYDGSHFTRSCDAVVRDMAGAGNALGPMLGVSFTFT